MSQEHEPTHYTYQSELHRVWKNAVNRYEAGERTPDAFFDGDETAFLASIGLTAQEMYDYAEDYCGGGDPDFVNVATVTDIRRSYFLEVQRGHPSGTTMDISTIPAKKEAVRGIAWLPRLIFKARAKLRGQLDPSIMYGCGGDRKFWKESDIHPAEFLRMVWTYENNDDKIVDWVENRRKAAASAPVESAARG